MSARHAIQVSSSRWNGRDPLRLKLVVEGEKYELQATDFEEPTVGPR
jgi:hypothetical protein